MTAAQIAEAVATLDAAGHALRRGNLSIPEQMDLGARCYVASARLKAELAKIAVPIADEAA